MKSLIAVLLCLATVVPCLAHKSEKQPIKIEIAAQSEDRAFKYQAPGLGGIIAGAHTYDVVFMVNAIINGDDARLKCYENHKGCTALGPGTYEAEIEKDSVWILITKPITHEIIRDHWKVSGTW